MKKYEDVAFPVVLEMIVKGDAIPEYLKNAKVRDLKNLTYDEVLFLKELNKNNIWYILHFHWFVVHLARIFALLVVLIFWFNIWGIYVKVISFLPIYVALALILLIKRFLRRY